MKTSPSSHWLGHGTVLVHERQALRCLSSTWPFLGIEREEDQAFLDKSPIFPQTQKFVHPGFMPFSQKNNDEVTPVPFFFLWYICIFCGFPDVAIPQVWFQLEVTHLKLLNYLLVKPTMRTKRQFLLGTYSLYNRGRWSKCITWENELSCLPWESITWWEMLNKGKVISN